MRQALRRITATLLLAGLAPGYAIAHPQDLTGYWLLQNGVYGLAGWPGDSLLTLYQRGTSITGVYTQDRSRYAVHGRYDPANLILTFQIALPGFSGDVAMAQITIAADFRGGLSELDVPFTAGGVIIERLGDLGTTLPLSLSAPGKTPTVVAFATPIPAGDFDGSWTLSGPSVTSDWPAPMTALVLSHSGTAVYGTLSLGSTRYSLGGIYDPAQRALHFEWTVPHDGTYRIDTVITADMRGMSGGYASPRSTGGVLLARAAPVPAAPRGAPTPIPCVVNGSGFTGWWFAVGYTDPAGATNAYDARAPQLQLTQQGSRIHGWLHSGSSRYAVTGSYDSRQGIVTLDWSDANGRIHYTARKSAGQWTGGFTLPGVSGGFTLNRRFC